MKKHITTLLLFCLTVVCYSQNSTDNNAKCIHIFVALCDNIHQGIVPVPAKLGNGQDHHNNLYWGALYGVRTHFKRSKEWSLIMTKIPENSVKLERLVFKHATENWYLIADAYDGKHIKQCIKDFLKSSSGEHKESLLINSVSLNIGGGANMVAYIGHDGLMEFNLTEKIKNTDGIKRDVMILACYSKKFFTPYLKEANITPLLWTTGLMSPEAYTIHDAIAGYINNESTEDIRTRAAKAYSKYQKCSEKAAKNLLVTGW